MLSELQAERQLLAIEAATVPHMKPEGGESVLRRWRQRLEGKKKAKSFVEALMASGIPITHVPKPTGRRRTPREVKHDR